MPSKECSKELFGCSGGIDDTSLDATLSSSGIDNTLRYYFVFLRNRQYPVLRLCLLSIGIDDTSCLLIDDTPVFLMDRRYVLLDK
jgi:hypothetical protein